MSNNFLKNSIIEEIRRIDDSLKRVNLSEITVSKTEKSATFGFISNKAVGYDATEKVKEFLRPSVPPYFKEIRVNFTKLVADEELVAKRALDYIRREFISVSQCVFENQIGVIVGEDECVYTLSVDDDVYAYFQSNGVLDKLSEYLSEIFCVDFKGILNKTGKAERESGSKGDDEEVEIKRKCLRTFRVSDVVKLWGEDLDETATYLADAGDAIGNDGVSFAGKIQFINERTSKSGKTYYTVDLADATGRLSCKIFPRKDLATKIEKLQAGSEIIIKGDLDVFNGNLSCRIKSVSFCALPENLVLEEKPSNPVPRDYKLVFPEPFVEYAQSGFFIEERRVPECLIGKTFVVVDIETTGLKYYSGDRITEIGAVKIKDGKITETFTTLIDPEMPIGEEATKLSGIDAETVKGKPKFIEVLPDFYKFCDGAVFVAHNTEFDYKFIKYVSADTGYELKGEAIDTLALSRNVLPKMKNYKLDTVCERFGIEFLHHRAMSDALATAKLFLELINIKKSL